MAVALQPAIDGGTTLLPGVSLPLPVVEIVLSGLGFPGLALCLRACIVAANGDVHCVCSSMHVACGVSPSIHPSTHPSIHPPIHPPTNHTAHRQPIHLPIHPPAQHPIYQPNPINSLPGLRAQRRHLQQERGERNGARTRRSHQPNHGKRGEGYYICSHQPNHGKRGGYYISSHQLVREYHRDVETREAREQNGKQMDRQIDRSIELQALFLTCNSAILIHFINDFFIIRQR
jgi:hypothetical protein